MVGPVVVAGPVGANGVVAVLREVVSADAIPGGVSPTVAVSTKVVPRGVPVVVGPAVVVSVAMSVVVVRVVAGVPVASTVVIIRGIGLGVVTTGVVDLDGAGGDSGNVAMESNARYTVVMGICSMRVSSAVVVSMSGPVPGLSSREESSSEDCLHL